MNILYIGQLYPKNIAKTISENTRGKAGFSNHNFELSLINGFSEIDGVKLRVLSAPQCYSYPHNNRCAIIRKETYKNDNGVPIRSIGFINIVGVNQIFKPIVLAIAIIRDLRAFDENIINVVVNPHNLVLLEALAIARKITRKNLTTILIVPDVPACIVEMNDRRGLKGLLVKAMNKLNAKLASTFDKYVFLTAAMNEYYKAASNKFIVMEGLMDPKRLQNTNSSESENNKKIILYTGTLRRIFGVMNLIDAFEIGAFKNCELWICGSGECTDEIIKRSNDNPSIKFWGFINSERALKLQAQATILANPRSANGNYTKYSFPSKTIEYLLAGKVVVMNRLPGIPAEYDKYLVYPEDESILAWVKTLKAVLDMSYDERIKRGNANREFILSKKTATYQCSRIVDFLKK